jgi:hypothetical protein
MLIIRQIYNYALHIINYSLLRHTLAAYLLENDGYN